MTHIFFPLAIIAAYLLGSIPFGLLIAKAHGKDLRSIGSGNIGATNVSRALGRKWAYFCFILDVLKGLIPMLTTMFIAEPDSVIMLWLWLVVGCAAILGHIFPIYLKFSKNPNNSQHVQHSPTFPRSSQYFPTFPNIYQRFPTFPQYFPTFPNASQYSPTFPTISQHFPTFPNTSQYFPILPQRFPIFPNTFPMGNGGESWG